MLRTTAARDSSVFTRFPVPTRSSHPPRIVQRKCTCGGGCPKCQKEEPWPVQAKLRVGPSNDPLEHEADHMAENVTGQKPAARSPEALAGSSFSAPPAVRKVLGSSGRTLDGPVRSFFESRFGHDFSGVRIHDDAASGESAKGIGARAYTSGHDIVFGAGEYAPETQEGRRLLAHELTHVVQQRGCGERIQREGMGDFRISESYHQTVSNITSSSQYQSLEADEQKLVQAIIAKIEERPTWPERSALIYRLSVPFDRTATKERIKDALTEILSLGLDATQINALFAKLALPFFGYTASGFDFSSRFFRHSKKLGFKVENASLGSYKANPYDRGQPDAVTDPAEKSFEKSDILFFSGHQYAQYKEPGNFTDDASSSCFNIGVLKKENRRVKLVASTSCATICKDVAKIWRKKFPDALILGYRFSAPLDGSKVANKFAAKLVSAGAIDFTDAADLEMVRKAWKDAVVEEGSLSGGPALLFRDEVELLEKGKWVKRPWDDKANECHYH